MSSLALVIWQAGGHQFAVEASRILALQPYTSGMDCRSLHQLLAGLDAEAPAYCLSWQADNQTCWLATRDEPCTCNCRWTHSGRCPAHCSTPAKAPPSVHWAGIRIAPLPCSTPAN